jgi:hypothetical protein
MPGQKSQAIVASNSPEGRRGQFSEQGVDMIWIILPHVRLLLRREFVVGDQTLVVNLFEPLQLFFERRIRVSGRRRFTRVFCSL